MDKRKPPPMKPPMNPPGDTPGVAQTSVPKKGKPAAAESEEQDLLRRNPPSEGSNYGFGTPAEGFGPRHRTEKPTRP